jgi:hypothetical protein
MPVLFWKRRRYFARVLSSTVEASTGYRTHSGVPIACHSPTGLSLGARNPMKTPLLHAARMAVNGQRPDISEPLRYVVVKRTMGHVCYCCNSLERLFSSKVSGDGVEIGRRLIVY